MFSHLSRTASILVSFLAANKGIGYGIAKILAEQGLTTVIAARNGKHALLLKQV